MGHMPSLLHCDRGYARQKFSIVADTMGCVADDENPGSIWDGEICSDFDRPYES
jgi:hypothetical protein